MTRVFPEPAPARMRRGPSIWSTASRCSGFRFERKDIGDSQYKAARRLEVGGWRLEVGGWRLEVGSFESWSTQLAGEHESSRRCRTTTRRAAPQEAAQRRTSPQTRPAGVVWRGTVHGLTVCPNQCSAANLQLLQELHMRAGAIPPTVCPAPHTIRAQSQDDSDRRGSFGEPVLQRCSMGRRQPRGASALIGRTSPTLERPHSTHTSSARHPYRPAKPRDRDGLVSRSCAPQFLPPSRSFRIAVLATIPVNALNDWAARS